MTFTGKKSTYEITDQLCDGDLARLDIVTYIEHDDNEAKIHEALKLKAELTGIPFVPPTSTAAEQTAVAKTSRSPVTNELIDQEFENLFILAEAKSAFIPTPIDFVDDKLSTSIISYHEGFHSLVEVKQAYPDGLDPRDAAWMWRRLLAAICDAHSREFAHCAIMPEHVLIHPEDHGLVLVDWCYAVEEGERCYERVGRRVEFYPDEILDRMQVSTATDLYMATKTMMWLIGDAAPAPIRSFASACLNKRMSGRPQDPSEVLAEFDELLQRLYGKRKFRPFTLTPV